MNKTGVTAKKENLVRNCVVCGQRIQITVYSNRTYKGGHFFRKLRLDKNKRAEYWECNQYYFKAQEVEKKNNSF